MTARDKIIEMLMIAAFEEICVVCYYSYFEEFLDETLGLFSRSPLVSDERYISHTYMTQTKK